MNAHHRDIVHVVDSHTEGEPTRVVIEVGLNPTAQPWRRGATSCESARTPCGARSSGAARPFGHRRRPAHGAVRRTLCGRGVLQQHRLSEHVPTGSSRHEDPGLAGAEDRRRCSRYTVGPVSQCRADGAITITNVPAHSHAQDVEIMFPGSALPCDVAWGGNWFSSPRCRENLDLANVPRPVAGYRGVDGSPRTERNFGSDGGRSTTSNSSGRRGGPNADSRHFVIAREVPTTDRRAGRARRRRWRALHARKASQSATSGARRASQRLFKAG